VGHQVIGGAGGWDYLSVDPENRVLYIAHGTQVETYNLDRDSLMRPILNTDGPHGVAIADRQKHGFISCGKTNSVLEFDLHTRDSIKSIPVGNHPDAIVYDPSSQHIFTMNAADNSISVLDASTGAIEGMIALPGRPEFAVSDQRGHFFVNLEDKSQIVKVDTKSNTIVAVWKVAPGMEPSALAMDRGTNRLFIGCGNQKMIVMNADNGKVVAVLPIGKGVDAITFDAFAKLAFSSNGEGNMTIVSEEYGDKFKVVQTLETEKGARTVAIDPITHDVYTVTAQFGATPEATKDIPKPRPRILPDTFTLLKYARSSN
jgi:DNA-binding beta-propeller fold protein YncE